MTYLLDIHETLHFNFFVIGAPRLVTNNSDIKERGLTMSIYCKHSLPVSYPSYHHDHVIYPCSQKAQSQEAGKE
jgi:hypothetical protein